LWPVHPWKISDTSSKEFRPHGGIRQIDAGEENRSLQTQQLLVVFLRLLQNAKEREELGQSSPTRSMDKSRGATERTRRILAAVFEEPREK
jgi:hypothetical protein